MANQTYNIGLNIISEITKSRYEMNRADSGIKNASFRISGDGKSTDQMWTRIKEENEQKLETATNNFQFLYQNLMDLKHQCTSDEWKMLLQALGVTLAKTENIEHVGENLWDARDLQYALNQTGDMIKQKVTQLKETQENGDEDLEIIINAELSYYENDMKKHHWGEDRLKKIYSSLENEEKIR
mgnify:CR=1 FL=1